MYVRLKTSKKARHPTLQIVEGVRDGKIVRQRTVASLGVIKSQEDLKRLFKLAENLIQRVEREGLPVPSKCCIDKLVHKKTVYDGFGLVVDKLMQTSGFSNVIKTAQGKRKFNLEEIVKLMIVQRFDLPSSKLRTYERQFEHGFRDIELEQIYRTMDAIEPLSEEFQLQAFRTISAISPNDLDCFFFDVTTLYFETVNQDEIRDFGFSKDQKHHTVQIVLALIVNSQGLPLAYDIFKGNLAETKTLIPVLQSLRARFSIKNATVVCDRGLASKTNVKTLQDEEFQFIIATKLRSISKTQRINDISTYRPLPGQELTPDNEKVLFRTMDHPQYSGTLLIATYSPSRAEKDRSDRERLLEKLKHKLENASDENSVKKVVSNGGYKKFMTVKEGSLITINQKAIEEDEAWDGFHGVAVSKGVGLTVEEVLDRYKGLWRVEEAFRVTKCTLKTRPIFHWKPHRIRAHMLVCFLALFIERFLEFLLRQMGTPLTPDRIRHALASIHTVFFEDKSTSLTGSMQSVLSEDAEKIFRALEIPVDRATEMTNPLVVPEN